MAVMGGVCKCTGSAAPTKQNHIPALILDTLVGLKTDAGRSGFGQDGKLLDTLLKHILIR